MTLAPNKNGICIDVYLNIFNHISCQFQNTEDVFGNKDRMPFLSGVHEIVEKMKSSRIQQSNNHLGIHMVQFCYHNDWRKNHVSAREAWSISDWEGSSHVHFDVTCTSRVLLERIVCKHRCLEKCIASKVFKVALISINIVTLMNLEFKATSFWMTYTTSLKHMLHLLQQLPALPE